ncbi:hypothetical protein HQ520_00595, partial [bacterium]|nr:hypothetical protein [bacterium]
MLSGVVRWAVRAMLLLILFALIAQAAFYTVTLGRRFLRDQDNTIAESAKIERSLAVARGEPLYIPSSQWPHLGAGYGALFSYPVGWISRAIGLPEKRFDQAMLVYYVGRGVSALGAVSILIWLAWMSDLVGLRGSWRGLPVLLFFSALSITKFSVAYRADFPFVALALWGWLLVLRGKGMPSALGAAALMTLAFHYKQTAVISSGILFLWLALCGERRRAVFYLNAQQSFGDLRQAFHTTEPARNHARHAGAAGVFTIRPPPEGCRLRQAGPGLTCTNKEVASALQIGGLI